MNIAKLGVKRAALGVMTAALVGCGSAYGEASPSDAMLASGVPGSASDPCSGTRIRALGDCTEPAPAEAPVATTTAEPSAAEPPAPAAPPPPSTSPPATDDSRPTPPPPKGACLPAVGWVGSQTPASRDATDDGAGANARFGYVIAMRFAPKTGTLWVNDGQIRTVSAGGQVTTRGRNASGGYANLGVDKDGNAFAYDASARVLWRFDANGGAPTQTPVSLAGCSLMSLNVGPDDHPYVLCGQPGQIQLRDVLTNTVVQSMPELSVPTDFAFDGQGRVWVPDPNNQQIWIYDPAKQTVRSVLATAARRTVFAAAADGSGRAYIGGERLRADGSPDLCFDRGHAYGLAASTTKVFVPFCTYSTAWGCDVRVVTQP